MDSHAEVNAKEKVDNKESVWQNICEILKGHVGVDAFQRWFNSATWSGEEAGVAMIAVPGEIHQVWIETNYMPELSLAVSEVLPDVHEVRLAEDAHVLHRGGTAGLSLRAGVVPARRTYYHARNRWAMPPSPPSKARPSSAGSRAVGSTPPTPSRVSWSAPTASLPTPPVWPSPRRRRSAITRSSFTAVPVSARPT